jgi:DNA-directed RNA polymerase II subunit RPB3
MNYCDKCSVELSLHVRCTESRTLEITSRNLTVSADINGLPRGEIGRPIGMCDERERALQRWLTRALTDDGSPITLCKLRQGQELNLTCRAVKVCIVKH